MIQKFLKIQFSILFICCFLFIASLANAATLYLSPSSQNIYKDNSFIVEVRINTEGEEINTADLLEIIDINKGDSILTLWPKEPVIQNGKIYFVAGVPNGFQGEDGLIARLIFRGREIGKGIVNFEKGSKVLLNDGKGTESQLDFSKGSYEIIKKPEGLPVISSQTHPDQNKWYKETKLSLYWDLIEGTKYSWILDRDPLAEPDEISDRPEPKEGVGFWMGAMEYNLKGEEDGIFYFHLRNKQEKLEWSPKVTFRAMIDTSLPEEFELQFAEIEGKNYLVFATKDVEYYEVQEGKGDFEKTISPYLLKDQNLRSTIKVKAVDRAGNERIIKFVPKFKIIWQDIFIILLILIVIGMILLLVKRILKSKKFPVSK